MAKFRCLLAAFFLFTCTQCSAQSASQIVQWTANSGTRTSIAPGEKYGVTLEAKIREGWHIYALSQGAGGPSPLTIKLENNSLFELDGAIRSNPPSSAYDKNFEMETRFYESSINIHLPLKVLPAASPGQHEVPLAIRFQTCNDQNCLPPTTVHLNTNVLIKAASAVHPAKAVPAAAIAAAPTEAKNTFPIAVSTTPTNTRTTLAASNLPKDLTAQGLPSFLWMSIGMGALSLLTPCVFPMIPITVSYFTKQSAQSHAAAIYHALFFALGIVLSFTALGLLLAALFGAAGVNHLAANPWVNLLITAIFFGFALTLLGAYFLQIPPSLISRIDGIARKKGSVQILSTLLMGLTFTLTSFTCTSPFVGTLLVMASQGNWKWPILGMLSFSIIFALPFFVLALAPQWIARLPHSGGWMNSIKVVMGLLEIAAAMKFLSNADLIWGWGFFTREAVLAVWVAVGVLIVLYLLGRFYLQHDAPVEGVSVPRLILAIVFLSLTVWLATGLLGRSLGMMEAFLPPEQTLVGEGATNAQNGRAGNEEAAWILNDYDAAIAQAKQQDKLVFIDFTGYTCTNCRWMEANVFPRPAVAKELSKFIRVRLYTDGVGDLYQRQQQMQQDKFGTVALPLYAIVRADGSVMRTFPGLTRDVQQFASFLQVQ